MADDRDPCGGVGGQASDVIGVGLAGGGEVVLKNRDEPITLAKPPLECAVLGYQAIMVKLQLGMYFWIDSRGHQLSAEVKLALSSQFLDG
jgi:hypothetical protein